MFKKGDTLIEVMLAVGIFSMVAIAIVAVMSGGVSGAQTALETTLAREEIDAQAEALRFIQSAYVAEKASLKDDGTATLQNRRFAKLWEAITEKAVELSDGSDASKELTNYSPSKCDDLYNSTNGEVKNYKAFVINTRRLGTFSNSNISQDGVAEGQAVLISSYGSGSYFTPATTYPRIIFGTNSTHNEGNSKLIDAPTYDVFRAEGIYIIGVKDSNTTSVITDNVASNKSAFYDFYIRTCWNPPDGKSISNTVSSTIRLYNPDQL